MRRLRRSARRQREALERAEKRANRTPQQQIQVLDEKLGEGVGATAERKRLHFEIGTAR